MKICILGGGLTGLAAAYRLSERHDIDLFEKRNHLGGCLSSYNINGHWIEQYYHHCFAGDTELLSLFKELNISDRLEWLRGSTGYYADNTLYPLTSPLEILRYPFLSLADKARLALFTLRAKKVDTGSLDSVPARDYIIQNLGEKIYASFFEPLLRGKFGDQRDRVSAAWLISRVSIRSNRGLSGERLGYLNGGFQVLIDALDEKIARSCIVRLNTPAESVVKTSDGWRVNGLLYDTVLSTIPPQNLGLIGGPQVAPVPYQGAACMTLGIDRDVTNGIYWVNMKDNAPYGAVISHTNFVPLERYGEHIVYLASYFTGKLPDSIDVQMLDDFRRRFGVPDSAIHWHRLSVDPFAGPVYTTGFRSRIPAYQQEGLYMAGMFSSPNYPERSMEGSIRAGFEVADLIGMQEGKSGEH